MRIINLFSKSVLNISLLSVSGLAIAHEGHQLQGVTNAITESTTTMSNSSMDHSKINSMENPNQTVDHSQHQMDAEQSNDSANTGSSHDTHDHRKEHGGQVYQRVTIDNAWMLDEDGKGTLDSSFELRVGTDENKLFIKGSSSKAESSKAEYDLSALYSRNIAAFWDVQAGVRYSDNPERETDQERVDAALGLHGLAQYFFETDAYLYFGQDSRVAFSLETSRDLLLTQKLILQPYLDLNVVFSDDSRYAKKSGLNSMTTGLETRYEITKKVMPYVSVAYTYSKGNKETQWQTATDSENGWLYGAGLRLRF
ncbi:MAG: copper resistance protein B [Acinetobacter sp.]|jgi:copper resistance protein B|uniref:copper resistance protein B n=1 Tax=Acinetobacter sp. TaxID=472 RepID=UPI00284CD3A1|nr:copper resistance protein B [Acinetobacter sp.]MDR3027047.1 copper resistance protein B [Acinetobacter sp.]